jgi:hypothetical protein
MMKNKKIILIFMSLFFLGLYFSTNLVLAIPEKGYYLITRTSFESIQNRNNDLTFKVENVNYNENIRQTVEINGFAYFVPSSSEIADKEISLLLSSANNTYIVDTDLTDRLDLRSQLSQSKVIGFRHGFRTTFSPLGIANGVYELYIYCYENEDFVGYINTDKVFIKQYDEFYEEGIKTP